MTELATVDAFIDGVTLLGNALLQGALVWVTAIFIGRRAGRYFSYRVARVSWSKARFVQLARFRDRVYDSLLRNYLLTAVAAAFAGSAGRSQLVIWTPVFIVLLAVEALLGGRGRIYFGRSPRLPGWSAISGTAAEGASGITGLSDVFDLFSRPSSRPKTRRPGRQSADTPIYMQRNPPHRCGAMTKEGRACRIGVERPGDRCHHHR